MQAQLAFILVEGTKLISHHSSLQKRRQQLVNAITCKVLKLQVVSKKPQTLTLQLLTLGSSYSFLIHAVPRAGHLELYHSGETLLNADSNPVGLGCGQRLSISKKLPGKPGTTPLSSESGKSYVAG